ncbi:NAD(P)/FAD-dependent oxidoreductase [Pseudodonghicola flavimaris]|uniref:NAD(P)/FAD-dependent oxidoreductase n=1 Tax=Pseudodonghicola flavimaris TaxID=3050036 RepID=A0ABT7F707_9RHOB|nr:NAD(P)/FAD-dependent oxidoreductase [Pseudodonghicola flavimaris]MDK3020189.1 NAD(P)/FAD-dependent oxidoreductase [Pseudodonghicola flavimaris]
MTSSPATDPRSVAGKTLELSGGCDLLVVGAGPAGIAAARAAVETGAGVTLVDENPVPFDEMGEHVPQLWGGRMGAEIRNRTAMMERMLEVRPDLADLFDLGVDLRLGTACWGLFVNRANLGWMPGPVAGLRDAGGSSLVGFGAAVIATGRRDMGLAFPGWDLPGVIGAGAAQMLAGLNGALETRRAVVLGTTTEALLAARDLAAAGVDIAAIVEQAGAPQADAALVAEVEGQGIPVLFGEAPRGVTGDADGVTGLQLKGRAIACDSVLLGMGAVPMIDLLQAGGARTVFDAARGGFAPVLGPGGATSLPGVYAAGDCAGVWGAKSADPGIAAAEGAAAARAVLGQAAAAVAQPPEAPDLDGYRKGWVRAAVIEALEEMPVCLCEEVTARDILDVRPPRYLKAGAGRNAELSLSDILGDGPPDPDQIKRLTRAGMGPCQGRRCREQIQALLALREDLTLGAIPLAGYRSPVRPMTLAEIAPQREDPAIAEQWDSWFGMPRQWVPFWDVEPKYTVASLANRKDHVSE